MMRKIYACCNRPIHGMRGGGKRGLAGMLAGLLLLSSLLLCGYGSYDPGDQRVFDDADLLTDTVEQMLQEEIEECISKVSMAIVVVTTDNARGKTAMAYADDFYDENGFGYGDSYGPGILFLIDMDNREIYISTAGQAISMFTDREINWMLDEIYYWVSDGYWYDACMEFVHQVALYARNEEMAQNGYYDETTDTFVEYTEAELKAVRRKAAIERVLSVGSLVSKLLIAMVIGAVSGLIMRIRVNMNSAPGGRVYMKAGSDRILQRYDHKTNTTVTTRHIPRNENNGGSRSGGGGGFSSSHSSGGGRSHGGGGRGF